MTSPDISFVVPCYNYGRFLPECLEGIFRQDPAWSFEIVAVDDASTDNTLNVLARFGDKRLRVLRHEKNQGHVRTMSDGLLAARGRYVARIDPDDRYRPNFLSETIPLLEGNRDVVLAYGDAAIIDGDGRICAQTSDVAHQGREFQGNEFIALLMENFICAPTAIARREAWLDALPLPPGIAFNDWYFNLMMARRGSFHYVPRVVADYRVHPANHHVRIVRDGTEEGSIRNLLDRIFEQRENDPLLDRKKRKVRRKVYAAQYLTLADKYFGHWMTADARRCYVKSVAYRPSYLLSPTLLRRAAATHLSERSYGRLKRMLKRSPA